MNRIKLYNQETERRRRLFAAVLHEIVKYQYPNALIFESHVRRDQEDLGFAFEGTEHIALISEREIVYGGSYLGVSTSPESAINRRLNRIIKLSSSEGKYILRRVVFSLAIECPRACLDKLDQVAGILGDQGILFEFWEARDVRRQIVAHLNLICPAFGKSHLEQLNSHYPLSCLMLTDAQEGG